MSFAWKMAVTVVLFLVAAAAGVILVVNLLGTPPTVDYSSAGPGQPVNVTLQTVGTYGSGTHPTWVSYLVRSPQGQWVHTTNFQVPQDTRINVTIYQYDSGSPLRNQQIGQVTGTYGNVALAQRQALPGHQFQRRERRGAHVLHALAWHKRAALRQQRQRQPVRGGAVHHELSTQHHPVLLHQPGPRQLPLAVLRALRARLPLRQRGADVDAGLHGWVHEGGCVSATDTPGPEAPPTTTETSKVLTAPTTGGG